MMAARPVVATDVGGVKEALGDCGLVVRPRDPEKMAGAILRLLNDEGLRSSMGEEARQRALTYFTIERTLKLYLNSYRELCRRRTAALSPGKRRARQLLLAQRAYALAASGLWKEAVGQFRLALQADLESPATPVLLLEMARAYNQVGQYQLALNELEKAKAMAVLLGGSSRVA
jgi:tetratricopeptide (TPR) repeat protein